MTSDNHRLNWTELHLVLEDQRELVVKADARLKAIVNKVLEMRGEIEDGRTYRVTLHLGRLADVKADLEKRY